LKSSSSASAQNLYILGTHLPFIIYLGTNNLMISGVLMQMSYLSLQGHLCHAIPMSKLTNTDNTTQSELVQM
jgi:hypothetical protein